MSGGWKIVPLVLALPATGALTNEPTFPVIDAVDSVTVNYKGGTAIMDPLKSASKLNAKGRAALIDAKLPASRMHIDVGSPKTTARMNLGKNATRSPSSYTSMGDARMTAKLREIAQLSDGWWGPGSRAINPKVLQVAQRAIPRFGDSETLVTIGPHPDGTLMLDWRHGDTECTAELHVSGRMTLTIDNEDLDIYVERDVEMSTARLVEFFITTSANDD